MFGNNIGMSHIWFRIEGLQARPFKAHIAICIAILNVMLKGLSHGILSIDKITMKLKET